LEVVIADQSEHDPLGDLTAAGVAVWLDDLSRELLAGGAWRRSSPAGPSSA
jgi:hypothetical protein